MTTGSTATTLVNRALQQIAARATVTGTNPSFDGTAAGNAAGILYTPAVNMLLREQDYEFARTSTALTVSAATAQYPWAYSYVYPTDCMRIRSVVPAAWTAADPQPVRWSEAEQSISGVLTRVILCNEPSATLVYSTNNVTETQFDAKFEETLVRYLASALVMALGGRPDFSKEMLGVAGQMTQSGAGRDS